MSQPTNILILSDGKPGHANQSLGLAEAMGRIRPVRSELLELDGGKWFPGRLREAVRAAGNFPAPDLIIGTGHATHLPLLWLSRKYDAHSIVLMRPSLPLRLFDFCIAPEHDFYGKRVPANVITSKGALNRVIAGQREKKGKLLLIGGPSKTHGYDEAALVSRIAELAAGGGWQLADSRRTPASFLPAIRKRLPDLEVFHHRDTPDGWLSAKIPELEEIKVTEDSVSMIYEALTGGAKVGVLEMPRLRPDARVVLGLEKIKAEGRLDGRDMAPLAEADRCAAVILSRM
ncbi:mitochondrial fission ELM1 family protein [Akkermansiaceae bacterium]|nr:mitochondrial fission ELM1 family protein [Akkermansiaceae bacterium]